MAKWTDRAKKLAATGLMATGVGGVAPDEVYGDIIITDTSAQTSEDDNPIKELTDIIRQQRAHEMQDRVISKQDEMYMYLNQDAGGVLAPEEPKPNSPIPAIMVITLILLISLTKRFTAVDKLMDDWQVTVHPNKQDSITGVEQGKENPYVPPKSSKSKYNINVGDATIGGFDTDVTILDDGTKAIEIKNLHFNRTDAFLAYSNLGLPEGNSAMQRIAYANEVVVNTVNAAYSIPIQLKRVLALAVIREAFTQAKEQGATAIISREPDKLLALAGKKIGFAAQIGKYKDGTMRVDLDKMLDAISPANQSAINVRV